MWILLMIIFNQPYTIDHIHALGDYPSRQQCASVKNKAIKIYNEKKRATASFGCVKIKLKSNGGNMKWKRNLMKLDLNIMH